MDLGRHILVLFLVFGLAVPLQIPLQAQPQKRLGVIDIESDAVTTENRIAVLNELKKALNDQRILALVRDQEVDTKLTQKNKLRGETEKLKADHADKKAEIETAIENGEAFFRASKFDEAIHAFEVALPLISQASLAISDSRVSDLLQYLGASNYFAGYEVQAEYYFSALLDWNPEAMINSQRFPPPIVELFNRVRAQPRAELKPWVFESTVRDLKISLAGLPMAMKESGGKNTVLLPVGHPLWGGMNVVVEREGFGPAIFAFNELPNEVKLLSTKDRRLVTRGLFAPLGATTPPVELKKLVVNLDLAVVFLGSVSKDLEGRWLLTGQWLEGGTSRTSPLVHASDVHMTIAVKSLVTDLLNYLDSSGRVISVATTGQNLPGESVVHTSASSSAPFYETWWFWTAVGIGVAGASIGGYYLLKPDDTLSVKVVRAN